VCQINNDYHENFDQQKLDKVIEQALDAHQEEVR